MHADLAEAVPGGLHVEHPDDVTVGHRHDRARDGAGELRGPLVDIDRRLGRDPVTLPGHCREQLRHCLRLVH